MSTETLAPTDLGDGSPAEVVDNDDALIPTGIILHHAGHKSLVQWVPSPEKPDRPVFTLLALIPLSILEKTSCPACGLSGFIRDGVWWHKEEKTDADA